MLDSANTPKLDGKEREGADHRQAPSATVCEHAACSSSHHTWHPLAPPPPRARRCRPGATTPHGATSLCSTGHPFFGFTVVCREDRRILDQRAERGMGREYRLVCACLYLACIVVRKGGSDVSQINDCAMRRLQKNSPERGLQVQAAVRSEEGAVVWDGRTRLRRAPPRLHHSDPSRSLGPLSSAWSTQTRCLDRVALLSLLLRSPARPPVVMSIQDALKKDLTSIARRPDNQLCADCRMPQPTWASFNLGLFMCMSWSDRERAATTTTRRASRARTTMHRPRCVHPCSCSDVALLCSALARSALCVAVPVTIATWVHTSPECAASRWTTGMRRAWR